MTQRFEGKTIIVTGAAGGIGRAAVERFAGEGANIVAVDLPGPALEEVRQLVERGGARAIAVPADVARSEDVEGYVREARQRFGGVDGLFNNAGIEGYIGSSLDYPEDQFDRILAINVKGVWLGMRAVIPAMRLRGKGAIVNTASVAGLRGNARISGYVASKHAVVGLTKSLALEFAKENIRINAVCPAPIDTRMMKALEEGVDPTDPAKARISIAARIPMGRYGQPAEVAALVAYLMSDDASFLTGGAYTVDGGSMA
jgi:NAD(P)-dependent dehydrogenase (short-subunit alcohol dehydrogenase family)